MSSKNVFLRLKPCLLSAVLCLILFSSTSTHAQKHGIRFKRYSILDGLSQNSVNCILQDRKGFMWFGTEDGLNRFDGYQFNIFRYNFNDSTTLSNNYVLCMMEDDSGRIWVGTQGGGLDRYDPSSETFVRYMHSSSDSESVSSNIITTIYQDSKGRIWIGTDLGLNIYDTERDRFIKPMSGGDSGNSLKSDYITSICEDDSGMIWIGTTNGLNCYDPETKNNRRYLHSSKDPASICSNRITSLCIDGLGSLWIGTDNGLDRMKNGRVVTHYRRREDGRGPSSDRITLIYSSFNSSNVIWIGTADCGLNRLDIKKNSFIYYKSNPKNINSISNDEIRSLYSDRSGGMWVGTRNGLTRMDRSLKRFQTYRNKPNDSHSLSYNLVWSIYEDRMGYVWIGTFRGLNRFDPKTKRFKRYRHDPGDPFSISDDNVFTICEDRNGDLWFGTERGGLNRYDRQRDRFIHYRHDENNPNSLSSDCVYVILRDRSGFIWIGTRNGGLNRFDPDKKIFISYKNDPNDSTTISSDIIYSMCEDHLGRLWIGTWGGGLNRFDRSSGTFKRYKHYKNNNLIDDKVLSIYESVYDSNYVLWYGTMNGLCSLDISSGQFTHYTVEDGLPNDVIYGILEDKNKNLWLSTNNGLSRFDPVNKRFKNYDVSDGLQSNEFNAGAYFQSGKGEMFFGGIGGFSSFYPEDIIDNPFMPSIVITDFKIFNKSVPIGEWEYGGKILNRSITETRVIKLPHKASVFSFEFAAMHFVAPDKNEYACMMEPIDKDWNYIGNNHLVTYANLPPDVYTFRVKASNNDGVWNEQGISIKVIVPPEFWQTLWFKVLAVLFVAVTGFVIFQIRVKTIRERARQLEEINKKLNLQVERRKKSERMVVQERNLLRTLIDNIPDFIYYKDKKSRFVRINKAQAEWLGLSSPEQALGTSDFDYYPEETARKFYKEEQRIIKSGKPMINREEVQPDSKGNVKWISSTTKVPLRNSKGDVIGIVGISRDITKQKETERLLKEAHDMLEQRVKERTEELHKSNQELREEIAERKKIEKERELLIRELKELLANVKTLKGMLPICARCKKIRDDKGYWKQVEEYIRDHSEVEFSHGLCPECLKEMSSITYTEE